MTSCSLCAEGEIWDQELDTMYGDKECGLFSTLQRRTPCQQNIGAGLLVGVIAIK
jgi:hypothetical protein